MKCHKSVPLYTSTRVATSRRGKKPWSINVGAALGQMATGGGASHLLQVMASVGSPSMSKTTFTATERYITEELKSMLAQSILEAGREEREHAISQNDYFQDIPAITVIEDGGWSKRSHKHSYNAKSGVAVIIGHHTKKLLFLGVRNKYCSVYAIAENAGHEVSDHMCYKNWNASSPAMESDILVEGFNQAERTHGVRYMRLVGDGDSSVLSCIYSGVPLWGRYVRKIECVNHVLKNYRARLEQIVKDNPRFKGAGRLTQKQIRRLTAGARAAIRMHAPTRNTTQLRHDLRNAPYYAFGDHSKCNPAFCHVRGSVTEEANEENSPNLGTTPPTLSSLQVQLDNIIAPERGDEGDGTHEMPTDNIIAPERGDEGDGTHELPTDNIIAPERGDEGDGTQELPTDNIIAPERGDEGDGTHELPTDNIIAPERGDEGDGTQELPTDNIIAPERGDEGDGMQEQLGNIIAQEQDDDMSPSALSPLEEDVARSGYTASLDQLPPGLFFQVLHAGDRLVSLTGQLIDNQTSNLAESYMGIRTYFDGGKIFNRVQSGSFESRCYAAGLKYQKGSHWITCAYQESTGQSSPSALVDVTNKVTRRSAKEKKRKSTTEYKNRRKRAKYSTSQTTTNDYEPNATQPDEDLDELHRLCVEYKESLNVSPAERQKIERTTLEQANDQSWFELRKSRLTASNFGTVARRRHATPVAKLVRNLLYDVPREARSLQWGRDHEEDARQAYSRKSGPTMILTRSGLVIHPEHGWLACSPDDLVSDTVAESQGLVEYKCPYSARDITVEEACKKKDFMCMLNSGKVTLKRTHKYYYQVQGQMAITRRWWCDFVIWTPHSTTVERINFDEEFWATVVPKLELFYDRAIVPELVSPRHTQGQLIRELSTPP